MTGSWYNINNSLSIRWYSVAGSAISKNGNMSVTYLFKQLQITMRFVVAEGCRLESQEQGSNPITAGVPTPPKHLLSLPGRSRKWQFRAVGMCS